MGQRLRYVVSQNAYSQSDQESTYRRDELAQDVVATNSWHPTRTSLYTDTYLFTGRPGHRISLLRRMGTAGACGGAGCCHYWYVLNGLATWWR